MNSLCNSDEAQEINIRERQTISQFGNRKMSLKNSSTRLRSPVWWDVLPDVSTLEMEIKAFDYFNERNYNAEHLPIILIVDLWRIVFDYFIHESRIVSLPIRIFQEINDGSTFSHFVIDADPLLKHFFTRFYGIHNGNPMKIIGVDYCFKEPITVFGHCNLYISEFYFRPLRILQLGLEPQARLLFKFEPRRRVWPNRKRWTFHLWPTNGKVFSIPKKLCDFIVDHNPKGIILTSDPNGGGIYCDTIIEFLWHNGSIDQRVDYANRYLNGKLPDVPFGAIYPPFSST